MTQARGMVSIYQHKGHAMERGYVLLTYLASELLQF